MTDYSRSNILLPHFEEAEAFLNALDGKDAQFTFQTFDDVEVWSDEKQKNIKRQHKDLVRIYHGTFNEHKQTLAAINKRGGGVFVTINETDLKGRKKENILKVRAVFVDLDGSPIQPILDLEEDLQPHIIIESSPNKWHAYWLVDNCSLELFPLVQRALAAKFNGDISVNNIDRVMRLTGFSHNKGESFITRIHTMQDNLYPYSVNKLIVGLGLELEQPTHKKQTFTHANTGDFEAVKRAAQGRWPAIFGRIGITLPPDNNHAPCPACGGTDRFRYDDIDGHGTFICNRGGNGILSGDGFALIQHKTGATSSEALNMVRGIVMPDYQKSKKAVPHSQDGTASIDDDLARESIDDGQAKSTTKPMLNVVTVGELVQMDIPPRENLLAPWLPMQGLAMVYAPRGIGKTFFALNVAYAVASGGEFLCWQATQAYPVLYVDGEMPVISMKERLIDVISMHDSIASVDALRIITPDLQQDYMMPDLATLEGQQALEPYLQGVKLIVIDNISTLCRSGRENESEGWIVVQEWALRQRAAGRSVLFVHHAGKGGNQRGTSKREDVLDTVINLKRPIDYEPSHGASFEIHFEKTRGFSGEDAEPLSCQLGHDQHGQTAWLYSRLEDSTFDKVVNLINEGLSQAEIASELDINKSNVSRHVKKARLQGLIKDDKKQAKPVNSANYSKVKDGE